MFLCVFCFVNSVIPTSNVQSDQNEPQSTDYTADMTHSPVTASGSNSPRGPMSSKDERKLLERKNPHLKLVHKFFVSFWLKFRTTEKTIILSYIVFWFDNFVL